MRDHDTITDMVLDTREDVNKAILLKYDKTAVSELTRAFLFSLKDSTIESYISKTQSNHDDQMNKFLKYFPLPNKSEASDEFKKRLDRNVYLMNLCSTIAIDVIETAIKTGWIDKKFFEFFISPRMFQALVGNLVYINEHKWSKENTGISDTAYMMLAGMLRRAGQNKMVKDLNKVIEKGYSNFNIEPIPILPPIQVLKNDAWKMIYLKSLVNLCDGEDIKDKESKSAVRLHELLYYVYGCTDDTINKLLATSTSENHFIDAILTSATASFEDVLSCLGGSYAKTEESQERFRTLINHDPFEQNRKNIEGLIVKGGAGVALGGLTLLTGGLGDFIIGAAGPLLVTALTGEKTPEDNQRIRNAFYEVADEYRKRKRGIQATHTDQNSGSS